MQFLFKYLVFKFTAKHVLLLTHIQRSTCSHQFQTLLKARVIARALYEANYILQLRTYLHFRFKCLQFCLSIHSCHSLLTKRWILVLYQIDLRIYQSIEFAIYLPQLLFIVLVQVIKDLLFHEYQGLVLLINHQTV